MVLADKILNQRKKLGWSQEDLAEKMNVSRQSVSKWESAISIPDLNKVLLMSEIFGVSTDYLLKDEIEEFHSLGEDKEPGVMKVSLENATKYVEKKIEMSKDISIGTLLCMYSVVPLFLLLALVKGKYINMTINTAISISLVAILVFVSIGIRFFFKSKHYENEFAKFEEDYFELEYGVSGIFKDKAQIFKADFPKKISLSISMIILSVVPLLLSVMLNKSPFMLFTALALLIIIVGAGVYLLISITTIDSAYNCIISEGEYSQKKKDVNLRISKLGGFYWPFITAIYIGWSLWTMNWHITWIIWPVAGIAFGAFSGLIDFLNIKK